MIRNFLTLLFACFLPVRQVLAQVNLTNTYSNKYVTINEYFDTETNAISVTADLHLPQPDYGELPSDICACYEGVHTWTGFAPVTRRSSTGEVLSTPGINVQFLSDVSNGQCFYKHIFDNSDTYVSLQDAINRGDAIGYYVSSHPEGKLSAIVAYYHYTSSLTNDSYPYCYNPNPPNSSNSCPTVRINGLPGQRIRIRCK